MVKKNLVINTLLLNMIKISQKVQEIMVYQVKYILIFNLIIYMYISFIINLKWHTYVYMYKLEINLEINKIINN